MADSEQQPGWEYKPGESANVERTGFSPPQSNSANKIASPSATEFSWQASEFSDHHRPAMWYLGLLAATAAISAVIYLLTKDKISTAVVIVLAILVLVVTSRKPRILECSVSSSGIRVGSNSYAYGQFKSFGILRETDMPSLELFSTKKLLPPVTVHFDAKDEKQITDIIGNRLPYEERATASIDKLAHRLRI